MLLVLLNFIELLQQRPLSDGLLPDLSKSLNDRLVIDVLYLVPDAILDAHGEEVIVLVVVVLL